MSAHARNLPAPMLICSWMMQAHWRLPGRSGKKRFAPAWRQVGCLPVLPGSARFGPSRFGLFVSGLPCPVMLMHRAAVCSGQQQGSHRPLTPSSLRHCPALAGIGGAAAPDSAVVVVQQTAADYYTQEEMAKARIYRPIACTALPLACMPAHACCTPASRARPCLHVCRCCAIAACLHEQCTRCLPPNSKTS